MKVKKSKYTYSVYKKQYKKAAKRLDKLGVSMFDRMLSRQEFWDEYRSNVLKNKTLPKAKQSKNITRDIVAAQTFSKSRKYATNLRNALKRYYVEQYGEENAGKMLKEKKITITNIQLGRVDFDALSDEYWYLKDQGYSSEEAAEEIAGQYFGS